MIEFGVKSCPPFIKHEESTWRHLTYPSNSTSLRFPYFPSLPKARLAVVSDPPPPGQPLKSTHGVVSSPPFCPPSFPLWLNSTLWEDLFSLAAPLPCFPCNPKSRSGEYFRVPFCPWRLLDNQRVSGLPPPVRVH
jgi:hypothetical protein